MNSSINLQALFDTNAATNAASGMDLYLQYLRNGFTSKFLNYKYYLKQKQQNCSDTENLRVLLFAELAQATLADHDVVMLFNFQLLIEDIEAASKLAIAGFSGLLKTAFTDFVTLLVHKHQNSILFAKLQSTALENDSQLLALKFLLCDTKNRVTPEQSIKLREHLKLPSGAQIDEYKKSKAYTEFVSKHCVGAALDTQQYLMKNIKLIPVASFDNLQQLIKNNLSENLDQAILHLIIYCSCVKNAYKTAARLATDKEDETTMYLSNIKESLFDMQNGKTTNELLSKLQEIEKQLSNVAFRLIDALKDNYNFYFLKETICALQYMSLGCERFRQLIGNITATFNGLKAENYDLDLLNVSLDNLKFKMNLLSQLKNLADEYSNQTNMYKFFHNDYPFLLSDLMKKLDNVNCKTPNDIKEILDTKISSTKNKVVLMGILEKTNIFEKLQSGSRKVKSHK